jgi:hypothetical protein
MTAQITHKFTSSKADAADATLINPSNWNDTHDLTITGPALLGKSDAGTGAAVEITLGSNLSFSGNTLVAVGGTGGGGGSSVGSATPLPLGTAAVGVSVLASREDHVHHLPSLGDLGIGNVNNTNDASKPVSTATATALAGKSNTGHAHVFSDVTGLASTFATKSDTSHTHTASNITDLANALSSVGVVPDVMLAADSTSVGGTEYVPLVSGGVLTRATVNQVVAMSGTMVALRNGDGSFAGMAMPGGGATNDMIVIGSTVPLNTDGRPNGTIYIQVG